MVCLGSRLACFSLTQTNSDHCINVVSCTFVDSTWKHLHLLNVRAWNEFKQHVVNKSDLNPHFINYNIALIKGTYLI